MNQSNEKAIQILKLKAKELHDRPRILNPFTNNHEADILLNNIEQYPHIFVFGCIFNRQTLAWKAWLAPCVIAKEIGSPDFSAFLQLDEKYLTDLVTEKSLHWMSIVMGKNLYRAIKRIHTNYENDASAIWHKGNPSSIEVIKRFEEFDGIGQKISTMAVNVLVRDFKVNLSGRSDIDISSDVHVGRVLRRLGIVGKNANKNEIILAARQLVPEYPGYFDSLIWEIGEAWCRPSSPKCDSCFLNDYCPKII